MKTKVDLKIEAARMAIDSEAVDFTKKACEIYDFLIEGIDIPEKEEDMKNILEKFIPIMTNQNYINSLENEEKKVRSVEKEED